MFGFGLERRRRRWDDSLADHRTAVERYLDTLDALDDTLWKQPRKPGHWSPAQITQHLIRYYEAASEVVSGDLVLRYRVGPVWRIVLRLFLVPHILFHGSFPLPAVAPREVRPEGDPPPRPEAGPRLDRCAQHAQAMLATLWDDTQCRLRHPYFGQLTPLRFLKLSTVHLEHHRRQVESVAGATP